MNTGMKIAVGMSGGVDSTITAWLLKSRGHDVIGLTMKTWSDEAPEKSAGAGSCYSPAREEQLNAIRALARSMGIPHHTIMLRKEFHRHVLDYFRNEYLAGKTPNPCLICNRQIKFGLLVEQARRLGVSFDRFATGHYANVQFDEPSGRYLLKRAHDPGKDQSYFLAFLRQDQLREALFPLGAMLKEHVKSLAGKIGLKNLAEGRESQDFAENGDYSGLFHEGDAKSGSILDVEGNIIGKHRGIIFYTIGQRKNLGLSGRKEPCYVVAIDAARNSIVVGRRPDLFSKELIAGNLNWIAVDRPDREMTIKARIRQQHRETEAVLIPMVRGGQDCVKVVFERPQMAVTPGQAVVFYRDDAVLGGGIILRAEN